MQTYIEISQESAGQTQQQELLIIGRVTPFYSRMSKTPMDSKYNVSVCLKLGAKYVNELCQEIYQPRWITTDIGDEDVNAPQLKIIRSGVHFFFCRDTDIEMDSMYNKINNSSNTSVRGQNFLTHVVFKVQILPQKHKTIEMPIHLFGELVSTTAGADLIRRRNYVSQM